MLERNLNHEIDIFGFGVETEDIVGLQPVLRASGNAADGHVFALDEGTDELRRQYRLLDEVGGQDNLLDHREHQRIGEAAGVIERELNDAANDAVFFEYGLGFGLGQLLFGGEQDAGTDNAMQFVRGSSNFLDVAVGPRDAVDILVAVKVLASRVIASDLDLVPTVAVFPVAFAKLGNNELFHNLHNKILLVNVRF